MTAISRHAPQANRPLARQVPAWLRLVVVPALVAVVGVLLSGYAFQEQRSASLARWEAGLAEQGQHRLRAIQDSIDQAQTLLNGLVSFYEASHRIDAQEFASFTRRGLRGGSGVLAFAWTPRVSEADRSAFEALARQDMAADFEILDRSHRGTLQTADPRSEHFPVLFAVPSTVAQPIQGFDLAGDATLREAIEQASLTRRVQSAPLGGFAAQGPAGLLLIAPAFGRPPESPSLEQFDGAFVAVVGLRELMDGVRARFAPIGLDIYLYRVDGKVGHKPVYLHASRLRDVAAPPLSYVQAKRGLHFEGALRVGDEAWSVVTRPTPALAATAPESENLTTLILGLLSTGIGTAFLLMAQLRAGRLERLTAELRQTMVSLAAETAERARAQTELSDSEGRYRLLVEHMNEGIVAVDENAIIQFANLRMQEMLGYSAAELVGRSEYELIDPQHHGVLRERLASRRSGDRSTCELLWRRKDGGELITRVSPKAVWGEDGSFKGAFAVFSDVTDRVRAEREVQRRDVVLGAINIAAAELMRTVDVDAALARAIEIIGAALKLDRIVVFERMLTVAGGATTLSLRHEWRGADVLSVLPETPRDDLDLDAAGLGRWAVLFEANKVVVGAAATLPASERAVLEAAGTRSVLVVPIHADGHWCGHIGFDDCHQVREWLPAEIEALRTLAELVGMSIVRARTHRALADAKMIIESSPAVLFRWGAEDAWSVLYVSENVSQLGWSRDDFIGGGLTYDRIVLEEDRARVGDEVKDYLARGVDHFHQEYRIRTKDGRILWVQDNTAVTYQDGRVVHLQGTVEDVTARRQAEARIAHLARHDALTDLPNRVTFMERLELALAQARRGGEPFAVLCIDLDHFKDVNDTRGHAVGDRLLREVAARLAHTARDTDTVARLGGDEFAILAAQTDDPTDAAALAQRVMDVLAKPIMVDDAQIVSGGSIGIAIYSPGATAAETVMMQADLALYRAKEDGRGTYRFHTQDMDTSVRRRVTIADELRTAIAGKQFYLDYQPQISLATGTVTGVEALIRWRHPERGFISPGEFIPIAEASGLILPIGAWVLDEALRQGREWLDAGLSPGVVAVNLSGVQFKAGTFETEVAAALEKHNFPPDCLELELTETVFMQVTQARGEVLKLLRGLGVRFAIDDFGTGYSSLEYLRSFDVDRLKIARSFIDGVAPGSSEAAIVEATIGLGKALGVSVLAEGVETVPEMEFLRARNCDEAQGYLFSRPVAPEKIAELLRRPNLFPAPAAPEADIAPLQATG